MNIIKMIENESKYEIVERKGVGHPDTLADVLAERLSCVYSKYTQNKYGAILHHNFDKIGIMGGQISVSFNNYQFKSPIRVLINGRASTQFGSEKIDVREILENETKCFFNENFPTLDVNKDIRIIYEVSDGSSPGTVGNKSLYRSRWFSPKSIADLSELQNKTCNDTSVGVAFYNHRIVEDCVYKIEHELNSQNFKQKYPWIGNDIKIMGCRVNDEMIRLTMAIPQICTKVSSLSEYKSNKDFLYSYIYKYLKSLHPNYKYEIYINTRDSYVSNKLDLYLTGIGSSVEMGDEGFVGRGNRIGGLITPFRPYSMEGICGKNPVYHTGKMYSIAAYEISKKIYEKYQEDATISIIGQSGHNLNEPWSIFISSCDRNKDRCKYNDIIQNVLTDFDLITQNIINGKYSLC